MNRRVTLIGLVVFAFAAAGFILTYIPKARLRANLVGSQNNLRALALFAAHHAHPDPTRDASKLPTEIPPGTIYLPGVPPDERLSWAVDVLPGLDQKRQNTEALLLDIDRTRPWTADPNQRAGRTRLVVMLCPENPPEVEPGAAAVTSYVGIAGVGAGAAGFTRSWLFSDPRCGAFGYDRPTPFDRITGGLSQTLLFGETRDDVGPWLRGGVATVRGLSDAAGAPPLVGGQFGGYFPTGANFALCDGGVRTFSPGTSPGILFAYAAVAEKAKGTLVGE